MPYYNSFDQTGIFFKTYLGNLPFTLFFLHGWSSSSDYYEFLQEYLSDFNVILWDARCHGKSALTKSPTIEDLAKDLNYFIHNHYTLGYPIIPVGHSMGAMALFEYVEKFSAKDFLKMVFVDISPRLVTDDKWKLGIYGNFPAELNHQFIETFCDDIGEGMIKLTISGLNAAYRELYKRDPKFFNDQKSSFTEEEKNAFVSLWKSMTEADYRSTLDKIDIPTLLIFGGKSQYYLKKTGYYMKKRIKDAKLHIMLRGEHSPFLKNPGKFCDWIKNFVLDKKDMEDSNS